MEKSSKLMQNVKTETEFLKKEDLSIPLEMTVFIKMEDLSTSSR